MKPTELFKVFILLSVCCTFVFSSDIPDVEEAELTQVGGYYIPEDGTISALLIYVQFPDDDYVDDKPWQPDGKVIPANKIVRLAVEYGEVKVSRLIRSAGGRWNKEPGNWNLPYRAAVSLGLDNRIIDD